MSKPIDNRRIFDNLASIRSHDPLAFDDGHEFVGRLLSDQHYLESMQQRLESHPERFKYYHPFVWRVVDGGHQELPCPGPIPPTVCETVKDCKPHAVPEPDSLSLLLLAIIGFAILASLIGNPLTRSRA